jgi:hypothetical protein
MKPSLRSIWWFFSPIRTLFIDDFDSYLVLTIVKSAKRGDTMVGRRNAMPYDAHRIAAEFHEQAAHAHRAAAAHHGKEDHLSGHEQSKRAMEHATKAFQASQEAHQRSVKSVSKQP